MFEICIVGAGFSGICAAVRLKTELKNVCTITIFDENKDFGGVWLKNTYPGCACEVPSHLYCFSWEPNPGWSEAYCRQEEILKYLQNIAQKHDLYTYAKFNHVIHEMRWDEPKRKWKVFVENKSCSQKTKEELNFDIIIHAQGRFASPEIPKEYKKFEGPVIHSAEWDKRNAKLEGRNVFVVGCGASGAQIIPKLAETSQHLCIYQRSQPWVMPRTNFYFPSWVRWAFANIPWAQNAYRKWLEFLFEKNMAGFRVGSVANKLAPLLSKFHLWRQVKNLTIRKQLSPSYNFGCKRIVNSNEYYQTFNRNNVTLIDKKIIVEKDSIMTETGESFDIDVIVLATGFQVQNLFGRIAVIGKNETDIPKLWSADKPKTYLSIMNSSAPNLFFLLGPNASTGYTTIIIQLETQVEWILKVIRELDIRTLKVISVKEAAEEKYMQSLARNVKGTVFGSPQCSGKSWYLNSNGDVVEIYPGSTSDYKSETTTLILNDLEFY